MDHSFQIERLQMSISSLRGDIRQTEQEIERLQTAKSTLIQEQQFLHNDKAATKQPELSYDMWRGKETEEHEQKRFQLEMSYSYSQEQLEGIITTIETKISDLRNSINNSYQSIQSKQSSIDSLRRAQKN
ncbi:DUF5082 domain-containing protein [Bacillus sp. JCM 19041]|uniref:DUF5082 domain-containing protein n=1 Tax=Bacillus sp. JCM 19041 TaxID=1460637 RepID=UPI0006D06905